MSAVALAAGGLVSGPNGKSIDVTFAFIRNNDDVVRLITAIPTTRERVRGMSPQEYDVVRMLRPLPQYDLPVGAHGTVVMVYRDPVLPPAYEVEFADDDGVTLALVTLKDDDLEVTGRADA